MPDFRKIIQIFIFFGIIKKKLKFFKNLNEFFSFVTDKKTGRLQILLVGWFFSIGRSVTSFNRPIFNRF